VTSYILKTCVFLVAAMLTYGSAARGAEPRMVDVISPDGENTITVTLPKEGSQTPPTFAVARSGRMVIEPSALNVILAGSGSLTGSARLVSVREDRLDETITLLWGKSRLVRNRCSLARLRLKSAADILWDLELRAYDDGVAFRYGFPEQNALDSFVLKAETTEFRLKDNPSILFTTVPSFTTSHESLYQYKPYFELPSKTLIDMPLLAVWSGGLSAALTEACMRDFPGMYLERASDSQPSVLHARLSPLPGRPEMCAIGRTPHFSPWRVVLLADKAGRLLESNLLVCLNDPPQGDFSWAQPGKSTWHWWNGTAEEGLPFQCGMNYETHKYYIDFCARNGITYHSIVADDRPWYQQSKVGYAPGPDTDILKPRPELEFARILAYAKQRGVGIRLWVHWRALNDRLEEAFTQYERWGIRGLMVDFLDRDDQEMVQFCERVLKSAARHKLHIQFHGSYKPSGEQRTFPNLFNREGVLNLEYLKWSDKCTPQHNVNVAYTRSLAGPTDYHLGGFRSVPAAKFKPRNANPCVLGTRCHHLALYVVYENPMPMVCDAPSAYEGQPGFEFLKEVPTTWDETHFLAGEAGEFVVVARRKGTTWYLGGITNDTSRQIAVPLDILGTGRYEVRVFADGSLSDEDPNAIRIERQTLTATEFLKVTMASGGGFIAIVSPTPTGEGR
jgi:alpha-glucosidase